MSGLVKGLERVEVSLNWDPNPLGTPRHDLDLIAATYTTDVPTGGPSYLVYFDSRSPDGTITLNQDSRDGKSLADDERMLLELNRLAPRYLRVVVGVIIQQLGGRLDFGQIANPRLRIREGREELDSVDLAAVGGATAARAAEFVRGPAGAWQYRPSLRGFDADPADFPAVMGS